MKRNPLPGAGVQADDFSEESFADERTPWEEIGQENSEGSYREKLDEHAPISEAAFSKPTRAWTWYSEDVRAIAEEVGVERYGDPADHGEWDFEIREQLADAHREVTYQMASGKGVTETALRLSAQAREGDELAAQPRTDPEVLDTLKLAEGVLGEELLLPSNKRIGHCRGYANCCDCRVCTRRADGWGRYGDIAPNKVIIRHLIEERLDKGPNPEARGGSRRRGKHRALRTTRGRLYRYDFTKRQDGRGKAGADQTAIMEWLTQRLVRSKDGRLWLSEEKIREVADYEACLGRGRKSEEQLNLWVDLLRRVSTMVSDGAQQTSIAKELGTDRATISRLLDHAKRLKRL